jgi:1-acyl-sn-glycerol-3-phosphate acyltransferase
VARMSPFFYYLTHHLAAFLPRLGSRRVTAGMERVPRTGAALLLCNHISHFDPPMMGIGFPRYIHFMADKPLLEIPIYGPMLRRAGVFPVDRTKNDIGALKTALRKLKDGEVVCIFPEEGIRQGATSVLGGATMPVGTASLWKKAGVPVIPMVILGTDQLYDWKCLFRWPRKRVFLRVGPVIPCDPEATREELRDRVTTAWRELYQGILRDYAVRPDELPKTAQERWGQPPPTAALAAGTDKPDEG